MIAVHTYTHLHPAIDKECTGKHDAVHSARAAPVAIVMIGTSLLVPVELQLCI